MLYLEIKREFLCVMLNKVSDEQLIVKRTRAMNMPVSYKSINMLKFLFCVIIMCKKMYWVCTKNFLEANMWYFKLYIRKKLVVNEI